MEQNVLYYLKKLLIYKNAFGFCEFYLDIVFYLFLPKQYSNNSYMAVPESGTASALGSWVANV